MNKVILMGRLANDPDVTYSQGENQTCIARYRLAVNRRFKREGDADADFISCVAFGKNGEFAEKYLHKGTKILVTGRIQTGSYEKDNVKHYTTDIIVEEHEFCESKNGNSSDTASASATPAASEHDGFMAVPDMDDLPFA